MAQAVKAYYAALSSGHEATACSMLSARIKGLLETSVERSPLLRGKGCVGAFKLLFSRHGRTTVVSPTVNVTGVRVGGSRGYALISTAALSSGEIRIEHEQGAWKIDSLIGSPLGSGGSSPAG